MRAKFKLKKVYQDFTGPEAVMTNTGERYMLNLIDSFMSFSWTYTLKNKSDAQPIFKEWKACVEAEAKSKFGIFCTDHGGEYTSVEFKTIYTKRVSITSLLHHISPPRMEKQNTIIRQS